MPKLIAGPIYPLTRRRPKLPTWKHVFHSRHLFSKSVDMGIDAARAARYPYFAPGDGFIYITPKKGTWAVWFCTVATMERAQKK